MKTIFITGVNSGLGKALFNHCIESEYFVYGLLRNKEHYNSLAGSLPDNACLILADVSEDAVIISIKNSVQNKPVDLVINNAGIPGEASCLEDVQSDELLRLFNVHCAGALRVTKALEQNLLSSTNGMVINVNSRLGSITRQANGRYKDLTVSYAYRIAKASQNMLTNCLREEFQGKVKFIALHPGKLKTDIAQPNADLEPTESAKYIIDAWESDSLVEVNGIIELPDSIIEW